MKSEIPTSTLVQKACDGDTQAFEQLILRYRSRLKRQIQARMSKAVRGKVEADDILQETFTAAFKAIGTFRCRDEDSFYRYLGGIAEHLIWNASQKKSLRSLAIENERKGGGADISPSRGLRRHERFDRLEKALAGLSPDHRTVIIMARIKGLRLKEIARKMNRSTDAVKKLLARALLQLRNAFGDDTESLHLPDRRLKVEEEADDE